MKTIRNIFEGFEVHEICITVFLTVITLLIGIKCFYDCIVTIINL